MTSKPTVQDKIGAIENVQLLIREFMEVSAHYEQASVVAEMQRISGQLEKSKQRLIHPAPKPARKPKTPTAQELEHLQRTQTASGEPIATFTPDSYGNQRRGRAK